MRTVSSGSTRAKSFAVINGLIIQQKSNYDALRDTIGGIGHTILCLLEPMLHYTFILVTNTMFVYLQARGGWKSSHATYINHSLTCAHQCQTEIQWGSLGTV